MTRRLIFIRLGRKHISVANVNTNKNDVTPCHLMRRKHISVAAVKTKKNDWMPCHLMRRKHFFAASEIDTTQCHLMRRKYFFAATEIDTTQCHLMRRKHFSIVNASADKNDWTHNSILHVCLLSVHSITIKVEVDLATSSSQEGGFGQRRSTWPAMGDLASKGQPGQPGLEIGSPYVNRLGRQFSNRPNL